MEGGLKARKWHDHCIRNWIVVQINRQSEQRSNTKMKNDQCQSHSDELLVTSLTTHRNPALMEGLSQFKLLLCCLHRMGWESNTISNFQLVEASVSRRGSR